MFTRSLLVSICAGSVATAASAGTVVSVALSSNDSAPSAVTDAGVIGDAGDSWNVLWDTGAPAGRAVPVTSGTALLDGSGNATSYTVDVSAGWGGHDGTNGNDATPTAIGPFSSSWFVDAAGGADGYANDNSPILTLNGFTPGDIVDLVVYTTFHYPTGGATGFQRGAEVTVNGNVETSTGTNSAQSGSYVLNQNYVSFDDLIVDGTGSVVVNFAPGGGTDGGQFYDINGLQFSVVPEPSSLALIGLGGLSMLRRRRN